MLVWYGYILIPLVIVVLFCVAFQEPGVDKIAGITFPLSNGLSTIFRISTSAANGFSIPVLFGATHSLSITTSHYINGLANSGLLPRYLKQRTTNNVPFFALISCSVVGYTIMVVMWLIQKSTLGHLFNISLLMHWSVSFAVCSGFLSLRYKFSALKRSYNNILGNLSAIYGICVFLLVPISLIGFQRDNQFALVFFLAFTLLLTFYHFYMGRVNQVFSPEEKALMLNAYVIQGKVSLVFNCSRLISLFLLSKC